MIEEPSTLDRFFREIGRRRLLPAAGGYAIVCWFLVQTVATVVPAFGWPEWTVRAAMALLPVGLPVVLAVAWMVNAGPEAAVAVGTPEPTRANGKVRRSNGGLVAAMVLLFLLGAGARLWRTHSEAPPPASSAGGESTWADARPVLPTTVAVLPLRNLSGQAEDAYFADGVTVEIMNAVAQVPGLGLVARSSAFAFRDVAVDVRRVREELGAGSVLEGSVRRAGQRVRIDVALVDTGTGREVWSEQYDRELSDIFALEDEIARAVARALQVRLTGGPARSAATASVPAHDLHLLGLYHWNRRTGPDLQDAVEYFARAVEDDPDYAHAYAGLAAAYVLLPLYADVPGDEAYPKARAAAETALALDSTLAHAHSALANVEMAYGWDWAGAEARFRRAISLDPSYATAHEGLGFVLDALGRPDEAAVEHERAQEADPGAVILLVAAGLHQVLVTRYDSATALFRRALSREPQLPIALSMLAQTEALAGRPESASVALARWAGSLGVDSASAVAIAGAREGAVQALARADIRSALKPFQTAVWFAVAGDTANALASLERAADAHDYQLFAAAMHPAFRSLRASARYDALLRRIGLR